MKRMLLIGLCLLFLPIPLVAQDSDSPKPDRWRGLIIDESTPEQAIEKLGKPTKDAMASVSAPPIDKWLTEKRKQKIYRQLEFKELDGIDKAWLFFQDNKLVMMFLDLKSEFSPHSLKNSYGIEFEPIVGRMDEAFARPGELERNQGKVYPKTYPTVYYMVGVSEKTFIIGGINNQPGLGRLLGAGDQAGTFPGKVMIVQIVSRKLENRDGSDVLK